MKIGINLLYLIPGRVGGTETYARELIPLLARDHELLIFCGIETTTLFSGLANVRVVTLPLSSANRVLRIILEQTLLPLLATVRKVSVLFSLGYSAPLIHTMPSVVTIHDLNWYYHPEDFSKINLFFWKYLTILSARFSTRVITDSTYSATSIRKVLNLKSSQVVPILHAGPTRVIAKMYSTKRPYLLTVVASYPHKNLSTLLKAFASLSSQFSDLDLYICGLSGRSDGANSKLIKSLGLEDRIKIKGYVSREELASLYLGATAFVFPSAYEGFGYPVLEAMSYATPVVSSNTTSLTEVVGNGGILVDPYDEKGFATAITTLLKDAKVRRKWIERGAKRLTELKWEDTARATLKVLLGVTKS